MHSLRPRFWNGLVVELVALMGSGWRDDSNLCLPDFYYRTLAQILTSSAPVILLNNPAEIRRWANAR